MSESVHGITAQQHSIPSAHPEIEGNFPLDQAVINGKDLFDAFRECLY